MFYVVYPFVTYLLTLPRKIQSARLKIQRTILIRDIQVIYMIITTETAERVDPKHCCVHVWKAFGP
jgi:hypothetical protein